MDQLFAILRTLNRHRYKLVIVPLLVMGLIYYFTANTPKKYKTEAKLYLNLQEGKGTSLTDEDLKQYQVQSYFTNTVELLKSEKTIENVKLKVLKKGVEGAGFFAIGNENLKKDSALVIKRLLELDALAAPLNPKLFPDSIMIRFLNYHQLSTSHLKDIALSYRIMDSHFMKFELMESIPAKTQELAAVFIDALVDESRHLAKNKVKGHKDIIESLVRQAKNDLDTKIKKLEAYKLENNILNLGEHTKAIVVYLVQLEGQRANLLADVAAGSKGKTEVLNTVRNGNDLILDVSENKEVLLLKDQLKSLNRQMLVSAFEANTTVSMESLNANIASTKEQIMQKVQELTRKTSYDPSRVQLDLVGKYLNYDLESETSGDMIHIINAEIDRVTQYSRRFAPFESTISAYEQEISTAQNAYLVLLNKLNLTQTLEYASGESVVEVIDRPYLPNAPEPSKRTIIVAAGGISIFVLMAAVLVIMQLLDASITSVEKFERLSKLPVIAGLPDEGLGKSRASLKPSVDLIGKQQSFKLLQQIISKCIGEQGILMITSSQKLEGKHFLADKLRTMLMAAGYKVAFVDADWMSPSVIDGFVNLKDRLAKNDLFQDRKSIIESLNKMKEENDLVVIVTSPINLSAEAEFWMQISQHVLYVFRANRLITKVDKRVEHMLLNTRLQFLGTVINGINIENMEDYLGEIPRERNKIRIFIKKLLTRNF